MKKVSIIWFCYEVLGWQLDRMKTKRSTIAISIWFIFLYEALSTPVSGLIRNYKYSSISEFTGQSSSQLFSSSNLLSYLYPGKVLVQGSLILATFFLIFIQVKFSHSSGEFNSSNLLSYLHSGKVLSTHSSGEFCSAKKGILYKANIKIFYLTFDSPCIIWKGAWPVHNGTLKPSIWGRCWRWKF